MQIKFIFSKLDWGGTDIDVNDARATVEGFEVDGKRYDFKKERYYDIDPFLYWDGIWLKEVNVDAEEGTSFCAHWACELVGDSDQDLLQDFERAFKVQALEHFLADRFIESAEFDDLFSFEYDEHNRKLAKAKSDNWSRELALLGRTVKACLIGWIVFGLVLSLAWLLVRSSF